MKRDWSIAITVFISICYAATCLLALVGMVTLAICTHDGIRCEVRLEPTP